MSAEATGWVWRNSPYRGAQLLVHLAIADIVNDAHDNEFWMSVPNLARKSRVDRSTVFRVLAHMQEHGFLTKLESGQSDSKPSRYRFLVDKFAGGVASGDGGVAGSDGGVASGAREASHGATQNSMGNPNELSGASHLSNSDPNCPRCHGRGQIYNATGGFDIACSCVELQPDEPRADNDRVLP